MSCISSGSKESTLGSRTTKKAEVSLVRLPAEEYITFVAASSNSDTSVEMRY